MLHYVLLFAAALAAGAINSVAGGGTLLTFPALLAVGVSPVAANATSTVALVPGSLSAFWGYRGEMQDARDDLRRWAIPSLLGGALGAWLAVHISDKVFGHLVPYLILSATGLFLLQGPLRTWLGKRSAAEGQPRKGPNLGAALFQFVVATYGGFFGAGIGILMLAAMGILGLTNIHRMNGLKNFAAICINGVATLTFIISGKVHWSLALLMMAAAIIGGYAGAGIARRVGQQNVRRTVVAIGLAMGIYTLLRPL